MNKVSGFMDGFSISRGLGSAVGSTARATKAVPKAIARAAATRKREFLKGFSATSMDPRKGTTLTSKQVSKLNAKGLPPSAEQIQQMSEASRAGIRERAKSLHAAKLKRLESEKGPSWAMRHPLVTAGAGALGYKAMFGQESAPEQRPQIIYPQQQY
jgi:phage FluMu protein gp41